MASAITGQSELYANLDFLERFFGTEAQPIMREETLAVAEDIAEMARELAPTGATGRLKSEIEVIETPQGAQIHSGAPYSLFVEFGTVNMEAQPFLRPAFHQYRYFTRVANRLKTELSSGLATA